MKAAPLTYQFIKGVNGTYTLNSDGSYTVQVDGDFDKFADVEIDGATVAAKNYVVKSGSTIITFNIGYMNTLKAGAHAIKVNYTDGSAETSLTVKEKTASVTNDKNTNSPQTGDHSNLILLVALLFISGGALTLFGIDIKGKKISK